MLVYESLFIHHDDTRISRIDDKFIIFFSLHRLITSLFENLFDAVERSIQNSVIRRHSLRRELERKVHIVYCIEHEAHLAYAMFVMPVHTQVTGYQYQQQCLQYDNDNIHSP